MRVTKYKRGGESLRGGATVLEVLFAVFVIVVGLLGIASLIPMAARNADESNAFNQALTQGKVWGNDFLARGFNDPDSFSDNSTGYNWVWLNDNPPGGFVNFQKSYLGFGALPGTNTNPTFSAMTANQIVRIWGHQSVCIDPVFFSSPTVQSRISAGQVRYQGYRVAVFPYFEDGYNPVTDPFAGATNAWHDQPRMLRVTLSSVRPMPNKLVQDIFASVDDVIAIADEEDDTLPATRVFTPEGAGAGKSVMSGEFSWMVTLVPEEVRPATFVTAAIIPGATMLTTTDSYLMSLVIMNRRDKEFIGLGDSPQPGSDLDKPQGERLTWVVPLSGNFTGGAGGRVRLISNANTDSRVRIGDWIMLGKHYLVDGTNTDHRYAFFRWYRIIAVDAEARRDVLQNLSPTGTDPYGNAAGEQVWSRDVVLEGPDWNFTTAAGGVVTPTTGTLMSHVVTVIERSIEIE